MPHSQDVFGRTVNKKCLVSETCSLSKKKLNCCEVRNDDDNDGGSSLFIFRPLTVSLASSMTNNCNYICCILPYKFPFKLF